MNSFNSFLISLFISFLFLCPAYAQEQVAKATPQENIVLKGEWRFQNSFTGRKYRGDIEIKFGIADDKGVYHGKVSYDGYQTDGGCTTMSGFFSDKPVDAEAIQIGNDYKVNFVLICARGPRSFNWELVYGTDGFYTQDFSNGKGVGIISLKKIEQAQSKGLGGN
jgi:hypothetical protein